MPPARAHAYVSGRVQGVFFRAATEAKADQLGQITGWVRNLPDGRVEVTAEGPRERVAMLVEWLWRGPPSAQVRSVEVDWSEATGEFSGFGMKY